MISLTPSDRQYATGEKKTFYVSVRGQIGVAKAPQYLFKMIGEQNTIQ